MSKNIEHLEVRVTILVVGILAILGMAVYHQLTINYETLAIKQELLAILKGVVSDVY